MVIATPSLSETQTRSVIPGKGTTSLLSGGQGSRLRRCCRLSLPCLGAWLSIPFPQNLGRSSQILERFHE